MELISLQHVTKRYKNSKRPALDDISVNIGRGEFVFLVGPSGAGKSTFLNLLLREEIPTSGEIHVAGKDLRRMPRRHVPEYRRGIGCVFQDFKLLENKTVRENVAFALEVIGMRRRQIKPLVDSALAEVGLTAKADNLPRELSGGEQQRVSIARAYVNRPRIILADEPTGNLDPDTSAEIMQTLLGINRSGTTIIMATHSDEIVNALSMRVLELNSGHLVRDEENGKYDSRDESDDAGLAAAALANEFDEKATPDGAGKAPAADKPAAGSVETFRETVRSGNTGVYGKLFENAETTLSHMDWGHGLSKEQRTGEIPTGDEADPGTASAPAEDEEHVDPLARLVQDTAAGSGAPKDAAKPGAEKPGAPKDTADSGAQKDAADSGVQKDTDKPGARKDATKPSVSKGAGEPSVEKDTADSGVQKDTDKPGARKDAATPGARKGTTAGEASALAEADTSKTASPKPPTVPKPPRRGKGKPAAPPKPPTPPRPAAPKAESESAPGGAAQTVTAAPDAPGSPAAPDSSGEPGSPGAPAAPDSPNDAGTPEPSGAPDEPGNSGSSGAPDESGEPGSSGAPSPSGNPEPSAAPDESEPSAAPGESADSAAPKSAGASSGETGADEGDEDENTEGVR